MNLYVILTTMMSLCARALKSFGSMINVSPYESIRTGIKVVFHHMVNKLAGGVHWKTKKKKKKEMMTRNVQMGVL